MIDSFGFDSDRRSLMVKAFSLVLPQLKSINPDIVFLDIQMPDGTGFDVIGDRVRGQGLRSDLSLLHMRSSPSRPLSSVRLDYLLKPVDSSELKIGFGEGD